MKRRICRLSLFLSLISLPVFSQNGSVTGIITDSLTGQPVINLTVFIPSTTFGTTTNNKGEYLLDKLPPGGYNLMFRHLLYPSYSQSIHIESGKQLVLNLNMTEKTTNLEEVVIVGKNPDWDWAFKLFKEFFLGDVFESKCFLENPKDLSFYFDGDVLTATSKKPLEIVNRYLGYHLTYYLDYFKYVENKNPLKDALKGSYYAYAGSAFFRDLSGTIPLGAIGFRANREAAFKGSLRHFFICLYQNSLSTNHYSIRKAYHGFKELQESEKLGKAIAKVKLAQMDSIFSWYPERGESGFLYFFPYYEIEFLKDEIMDGPNDGQKTFTTDSFVLVFKDFEKSIDVRDDWISSLRISNGTITFDQSGNYWVQQGAITWTNLDNSLQIRVLLPADYLPKNKSNTK